MVVVVAATTIIDIKCICTTVASQRRVSWYRGGYVLLFHSKVCCCRVVAQVCCCIWPAWLRECRCDNCQLSFAAIVTDALPPSPSPHYTPHLRMYVCMLTDVEMSLKYMKFNMQFMQQLLLLLLLLLSSVGSLAVAACNNTDLFLLKLYYPSVVVVALNKIFLQFFCEFFVSILCNKKEPTKSTRELRV